MKFIILLLISLLLAANAFSTSSKMHMATKWRFSRTHVLFNDNTEGSGGSPNPGNGEEESKFNLGSASKPNPEFDASEVKKTSLIDTLSEAGGKILNYALYGYIAYLLLDSIKLLMFPNAPVPPL